MRAGDDDPPVGVDGTRTDARATESLALAPLAPGPAVLAKGAVESAVGSKSSNREHLAAEVPHDIDPVPLVDRERLDREIAEIAVDPAVPTEGGVELAIWLEPSDRDPVAVQASGAGHHDPIMGVELHRFHLSIVLQALFALRRERSDHLATRAEPRVKRTVASQGGEVDMQIVGAPRVERSASDDDPAGGAERHRRRVDVALREVNLDLPVAAEVTIEMAIRL